MALAVRILPLLMFLPALSVGQLFQNLGGQRAGTAVFPFLKIETSAAGAGMAGAGVAMPLDASSLFYNPANITALKRRDLVLSRREMAAGIVYDYFALAVPIRQYHTTAISYGVLHMEPMLETTEYLPFGTGREFIFRDEFVALTHSIQLADRFAFGTTFKYVKETLADVTMGAWLFDFGTYYLTGFRSLRVTSSFSNFGRQSRPEGAYSKLILDQNGEEVLVDSIGFRAFSPPTTFRLGAGYNLLEQPGHELSLAFQLAHPADNAEVYALGVNYVYRRMVSLRAGYISNTGGFGLAVGAGLRLPLPGGSELRLDYAYSQSEYLTAPQHFSVGFGL